MVKELNAVSTSRAFVVCKRCFSCRFLFWARSKDARERFNSVRTGRGVTQAVFFVTVAVVMSALPEWASVCFARHHNRRKECTGQSRLCIILVRFVLFDCPKSVGRGRGEVLQR